MASLLTHAALAFSNFPNIALNSRFFPPLVPSTASALQSTATEALILFFIHGLDSSSTTWTTFLDCKENSMALPYHRSFPSYCIDLRGHGGSDLGSAEQFTSEAVADDVLGFISTISGLNKPKVVIIGHSMGGRVAMLAAAKASRTDVASKLPFSIEALVVEDMDVKIRPPPFNVTWGLGDFDRKFGTFEDCKVREGRLERRARAKRAWEGLSVM